MMRESGLHPSPSACTPRLSKLQMERAEKKRNAIFPVYGSLLATWVHEQINKKASYGIHGTQDKLE